MSYYWAYKIDDKLLSVIRSKNNSAMEMFDGKRWRKEPLAESLLFDCQLEEVNNEKAEKLIEEMKELAAAAV